VLNFKLSGMGHPTLKTFAHKSLAGFMAIWLSGFVFLLCCVSTYGGPIDEASGSMASMSEHCKKAMAAKSATSSDDVFELSGAESFECCGFLPAVLDKNRKIDRPDQPEIVSSQQINVSFDTASVVARTRTVANLRPYVPDRQYTYIKNQVFRI
jgi:hypothetical protein